MILLPLWIWLGIIILHGAFRAQHDVWAQHCARAVQLAHRLERLTCEMQKPKVVMLRNQLAISNYELQATAVPNLIADLARRRIKQELATTAEQFVEIHVEDDYTSMAGFKFVGTLNIVQPRPWKRKL